MTTKQVIEIRRDDTPRRVAYGTCAGVWISDNLSRCHTVDVNVGAHLDIPRQGVWFTRR